MRNERGARYKGQVKARTPSGNLFVLVSFVDYGYGWEPERMHFQFPYEQLEKIVEGEDENHHI